LYLGLPRQALIAFAVRCVAVAVVVAAVFWAPQPLNEIIIWIGSIGILIALIIHAWWQASRVPRPYVLQRYNKWYLYCLLVLIAVGVVSPVAKWVLQDKLLEAFRIPSGSMQPTILLGDFLFVDKRRSTHEHIPRGTIVVHLSTEDQGLRVMKRVLGLPGDTIQMTAGALYIDGRPLDEDYVQFSPGGSEDDPAMKAKMREWQVASYIGSNSESYAPNLQDWGPLVVPQDSFFVLGDNRDHAYDSRYWGFLPADHVVGQPLVVYWSYDPTVARALPFFTAVRWSRLGYRLSGGQSP
jgi:signal peptidase I